MHANPRPRDVHLYQRALVCKEFPAYKLHELRDTPAADLVRALKLLELARQVHS